MHHRSVPGNRACTVRRRIVRARHRRGVALVMVLGALTILTVMLTEFQDETSAELGSTLSARDAIKAEYAARSAINLSRLLIATEPTIRKVVNPICTLAMRKPCPQLPVWQFADQVLSAFNEVEKTALFGALAGVKIDEGKNLGMEGAGFEIQIIDEDSKINVNQAARDALTRERLALQLRGMMEPPQFAPLFSGRDPDGQFSDWPTVCGAILDWVDFDQDLSGCQGDKTSTASSAPEDSFYQMLNLGYQRKNAPFDSVEELRLVRGIGDDFWATFIDPDAKDPSKRNVTVWGQGQINVNTAPGYVLWAIICGNAVPNTEMCQDSEKIIQTIGMLEILRTFTAGFPVFSSKKGFVMTLQQKSKLGRDMLPMLGLEPVKFKSESEVKKAITTSSKVFSLVATGYVKAGKRETRVKAHAVVDFRGAPVPPQASPQMLERLAESGMLDPDSYDPSQNKAQSGQSAGGPGQFPAGATDSAIGAALRPDPAGRVVYFRID